MENTQFRVEDMFRDLINKDSISPEQRNKLIKLFWHNNGNNIFCMKIDLFKPRKRKIKKYEPSAPPEYNFL